MANVQHSTLSGAELHEPKTHSSNHTDGTDDIQDATTGQKGLMTAAHATAISTLESQINDVWDDMRIVPGAVSFPGVADPALVTWQPSGSGISTYVYEFDNGDYVSAIIQLSHEYKQGSDLKPHIHWTPKSRGSAESGKTVAWEIEYSIANVGDVFPAMQTIQLTDTVTGTNDEHEITSSGTIDGTGIKESAIIVLNIKRGSTDTWSTNTNGNMPAWLECDIHYQKDKLGTTTEIPV